jgi:hypothetical protein
MKVTIGCFYYAPDLPFIEQYLDSNQFSISRREITGNDFNTAIVKRLK